MQELSRQKELHDIKGHISDLREEINKDINQNLNTVLGRSHEMMKYIVMRPYQN